MADEVRVGGTVRGVQNRTEVYGGQNTSTSSMSILLFRLDPDDGGRPVQVELRGSRINGTVVDGEVVDAYGRYARNGSFRAKRIVSRETGVTVDTRLPTAAKVAAAVVGAVVLGILVFVAVSFLGGGNGSEPSTGRTPTPIPSASFGEDIRRQFLQQCLDDPNFTDDQCRRVYGSP